LAERSHSSPIPDPSPLAATPQCAEPQSLDRRPKLVETREVSGHGVVIEPALDHLAQPASCVPYVHMQAAQQFRFDLLQLGSHLLGNRPAFDGERSLSRLPTDVGEAEKVKRFRFSLSPLVSAFGRIAPELDQASFLRVEFQSEFEEPVAEFSETAFRIGLFLKPDDEVIRVTDNDHVARCPALAPVRNPEVEHVVQEHVRQEER